jgi:hypothetical protein
MNIFFWVYLNWSFHLKIVFCLYFVKSTNVTIISANKFFLSFFSSKPNQRKIPCPITEWIDFITHLTNWTHTPSITNTSNSLSLFLSFWMFLFCVRVWFEVTKSKLLSCYFYLHSIIIEIKSLLWKKKFFWLEVQIKLVQNEKVQIMLKLHYSRK